MNTEQTTIHQGEEVAIPTAACPCCSGLPYEECCQPILAGRPAPTAEALVRSRYTAFAVRSRDHVVNTHAPEIRDDFNRAEAERLAEECEWKSLRIHKAIEDGDQASVEYVMEVRKDGNTIIKGVKSDFRRENGRWLFASTKPAPQLAHALSTKVSRNDPCPCASGKKYKKCCGA